MNKLTGTITAKENIKGKLNNKEVQVYPSAEEQIKADITDIKSKNTEQDKKIAELEKENIKLKNQIPNGQASGNNIHIEDSSDLELKWKLNGGHKQETRSGRNLYNIKNVGDRTIPPEISIDDDDWITVTADNSSGTSGKYVNYFTKNLNLKPNTQYSLIAEFKKCTGDDSVSLSLFNNGNNEGQFNSTHSLKISSIKENNTKKSKFIITTKADLSNTKNGLRTYLYMPAGTLVIITFRISVIEDTSIVLDDFEYEKYGVSPSPDYPSEIETVSGSVKIDVVNNNLSDFNVTQDGKVKVNEDGTITINGNGGFNLKFRKFIVKANTKYYLRWELISGTVSGGNIFMNPILKKGWINKDTFVKSSVTEDSEISGIWVNVGAVFSNAKIKIWISKSQNDFTKHQSQSVTMPIQQEMLEGDYIDDVEHHEWGKIILTGEEDWTANWQNNDQKNSKAFVLPESFFGNKIPNYAANALKNNLVSHFSEIFNTVWSKDVDSVAINSSPTYSFQIRLTKETLKYNDNVTGDELKILFQSWLKSQYDAGTPVIVYYKLATPTNLELTTEQKAIREQKLHTYKNVTNIDVSDELASIDVNYKKDPTTEHDELQNQIDEIKQLISTTETSALLLDNLQKDVESEVE